MTSPAVPRHRKHALVPDSHLDIHPVGTWLLELGFDLWIRTLYRREIVLPGHFESAPGTLIACNHQRDVDGPMLGTVLVRRRGLHFERPLPFYATREDLFRPGILARLTVRWPKPLAALLGRISLAWFFPLGRAEPMRRVREFTLGEALRALRDAGCGGADCAVLLNPRGQRELGVAEGASLDAVLARVPLATLERWWGLRRLTVYAIRTLAPAFRATVATQLTHFATRLDDGCRVYFAPEGTVSMDGHFGRIRAGLFRLSGMAATPPWIQPMALGYDALAPGRTRVVIRIGERFRADADRGRRSFDAALRRAVLSLAPVTPSHLLARFLLHGPETFTIEELAAWLAGGRARLHANGVSLDPLWSRPALPDLVGRRVHWLARKRLITRAGARLHNSAPRDAAPGWHTAPGIARYLDNNLADLVPDVESTLPC